MFYLVKTPWWLKKLYRKRTWEIKPGAEKAIYLSFDDGPHPRVTSFVLDELKLYEASATFFCIGKNVAEHPAVYSRILQEGHAVGNHTQHHLNGWKTTDEAYMADIHAAGQLIGSGLFRPPYGRMRRSQEKKLLAQTVKYVPVMWTVLSGDFDPGLSAEQCLDNVLHNTGDGSIVVFHDSEKAEEKLRYALPLMLKHFSARGFVFKKIES